MNYQELNELQIRLQRIKSEPNGIVRETMIDNFLIDMEQKDLEGIEVEHHIGGDADIFVKDHRGNLQGKERFELLSMLKDFAVNSCIKYHQHFAKQPHSNEWVKVEDGLPNIGDRILCIENDGDIQIAVYGVDKVIGEKDRVTNKPIACFLDEQDEQPSFYLPTHWMPLPKNPKK